MINNTFTPDQLAWLAALETTEQAQTVGALENSIGFCCLGIACNTLIVDLREVDPDDGGVQYGEKSAVLPTILVDRLDVYDDIGSFPYGTNLYQPDDPFSQRLGCLTQLNDTARLSFRQIAAFIRWRPGLVFKNFTRDFVGEEPAQPLPIQERR